MSAELTVDALGCRKSRHGRAVRRPAHQGHTPSLSISEANDRKVLVRCHAGCDQDKVINRLRARGLWPRQRPHWPWLLPRDLGVHGRSDLDYVDRSEAARVLGLAPLAKLRLRRNGPPYCKPGRRVVDGQENLGVWLESRIARNTTYADAPLPKSLTGQP